MIKKILLMIIGLGLIFNIAIADEVPKVTYNGWIKTSITEFIILNDEVFKIQDDILVNDAKYKIILINSEYVILASKSNEEFKINFIKKF